MKHFTIVANWKMYPTVADAHIIATSLRNELEHLELVKVVICPPALWLTEVAHIIHKQITHLKVGIQNIYDQEEGAFTGEISAKMAVSVAQYVICGHSERVEHFREGPEFINSKVQSALKVGLTPIVCIGERDKNEKSKEKIIPRLKSLVAGVSDKQLEKIIVAYEPVWAIGSNRPDSPEDTNAIAGEIKNAFGEKLQVIYGGSIDGKNAGPFLRQKNINGLLVGRASLNIKSFVSICRKAEDIAKDE